MTTITAELLDGETKRDGKGRRITSAARRAELVAAYRTSGLTMEQFARQEGINPLTLAKWSCLHRQGAVKFAEMKVGMPLGLGWAFEVTLPNGVLVRAASAAAVAELLGLVGGR